MNSKLYLLYNSCMKQITLEAVPIGENNEIVLPHEYLEALGVGPGDLVQLKLADGQVSVTRKPRLSFREAAEKYGRPGKAPTLEELRRERGWDEWQ
jgi:antitoxin component of MazEF toxin-antitoxin module